MILLCGYKKISFWFVFGWDYPFVEFFVAHITATDVIT